MRSQALFIAGATVAAANPFIGAEKRQLGEACQSAIGGNTDLLQNLPQPPTESAFLAFLAEQTGITASDECEIPAVTGDASQASTYSSWMSEVTSWAESNREDLQGVLSACAEDPFVSNIIDELQLPIDVASICTEYSFAAAAEETGAATATSAESTMTVTSSVDAGATTSDASASETDASASESEAAASESADASGTDEPAAAAHQTGMAVAAVAAAGLALAGMY